MGFPPSGSGQIHSRASLTPASQTKIERKLFDPVSPIENAFYKDCRDRLSVTFDLEEKAYYRESDDQDNFHPRELLSVNLNLTAFNVPVSEPATIGRSSERLQMVWRDFHVLFNSRTRPETVEINSEG